MNHRTDPRPMIDRWRSLGFHVEWSDDIRGYVVWHVSENQPIIFVPRDRPVQIIGGTSFPTIDAVEAWVVEHAEVKP